MKSNLIMNRIFAIQSEYKDLLEKLLPKIRDDHSLAALDEINLFWVRHIDAVQLFLRMWFPGENSYAFTAATFLDYDDGEHLPFLLMGDKHVLDDPLSAYSIIYSNMPEGSIADNLLFHIVKTVEDNIKILKNALDTILIMPLRQLSRLDADCSQYKVGEQLFLSLFIGVESIEDYFSKCVSFDDVLQVGRGDIEKVVMLSESDDTSLPFKKRFYIALQETKSAIDPKNTDAFNFYMLVYGCIQQAVSIAYSCIDYDCVPYIRNQVAIHYFSLLTESMLDNTQIITARYKMFVAFAVHNLCDKDRLSAISTEEFIRKTRKYKFYSRLFQALSEKGINEKSFIKRSITQIVLEELDKLYDALVSKNMPLE